MPRGERNVSKITTTENVVPEQEKAADGSEPEAPQDTSHKMYSAYVHGESIQTIADRFRVDTSEVLAAVKEAEAKRK